jgi:hypothetical protein
LKNLFALTSLVLAIPLCVLNVTGRRRAADFLKECGQSSLIFDIPAITGDSTGLEKRG